VGELLRWEPDFGAIDGIIDEPYIDDLLEDVGQLVADAAERQAPRESGQGAASIHVEVHRGSSDALGDFSPESDEPIAYISWDQTHYYLIFAEEGTEDENPRPFLVPSLDQVHI
jgi:hypothetical protein